MLTKVKPNRLKSESLRKMAEITLERLEKTDREAYPSNTLLDYYDTIHRLMEAFTLKDGIKIKGEGAHQELIDYLALIKVFDEQTRIFLQQMRDYRNRISYEGFMVHRNYIVLNKEKIRRIIEGLFGRLK